MDTAEFEVIKYRDQKIERVPDCVVREEPLEIFVNNEKKYFCMRMPEMDYEMGLGILYGEGMISSISDVESFEQDGYSLRYVIRGETGPGVKKVYASSGSIFSDELVAPPLQSGGEINAEKLFVLQREFFAMQKVFNKTGAVHASAFYSPEGKLISFAEDVGRHNALDKCMGRALAAGEQGSIFLIMLSSRLSFEMIRKSFRTGAAVVAGVSAPTSAAVDAAASSGITLIGFLRGEKFNIYSHPERVADTGRRPR